MKDKIIRTFRWLIKWVIPRSWRPGVYLWNKVLLETNARVYQGPFKGMKYIRQAYCSALQPKVIGVYELEIQPQIEQACRLILDRIIDIGAAEGYYAAGFAFRRPDIPVIAFELDSNARKAAASLLILNGLDKQVSLCGRCTPSDLAGLTRSGVSLVICDCEGAEIELLDITTVPGLIQSYILVETHEFLVPGVTQLLQQRFASSHKVKEILQRPRERQDFPFVDWYIMRMQNNDLIGAMSEGRPTVMQWLWMEPLYQV